jgi:hypothetical protein
MYVCSCSLRMVSYNQAETYSYTYARRWRIYVYIFFLFYWRYHPRWVLAFSVILFHPALSSHCFLHRLTPLICKSSSMPAIHLFRGLPLVLVPIGIRIHISIFVKSRITYCQSFFYSPTDVHLNCLKNNFKIYIKIDIKTAPTCFGVITSSSVHLHSVITQFVKLAAGEQ